jgi:hypothetical protein
VLGYGSVDPVVDIVVIAQGEELTAHGATCGGDLKDAHLYTVRADPSAYKLDGNRIN